MKILFADAISQGHLDSLRRNGHDVVMEPSLQTADLP